MHQRGVSEQEVLDTVVRGSLIPARKGRVGFRHTCRASGMWRGRPYRRKQIIAYAAPETNGWLAITVIVKYLRREETLQ